MSEKYFAGGFLFHPPSRSVLLQFRGSKTVHSPNTWCFLGGWSENEDGDDPAATWRREMREELGITIPPKDTVALTDYLPHSNPYHRYIFYSPWPSLSDDFHLAEDETDLAAVKWFTIDEALTFPILLTDGTRRDLLLFREHL